MRSTRPILLRLATPTVASIGCVCLALFAGCSAGSMRHAERAALHAEFSEPDAERSLPGATMPQSRWERVGDTAPARSSRRPKWRQGDALLQGYLGIASVQELERKGGNTPRVDGSDGTINQFPVLAGGTQLKLAGEGIALGVEGMFSVGGRANGSAVLIGGGGAAVAVSLDMLLLEFYGGPFVSVPLGDVARIYGAAGPSVNFASYHQARTAFSSSQSGSGFGLGYCGRTGIELQVAPGSFVGIGVRWSDSRVNLNHGLGKFDLQRVETMLTFSVFR